MQLLQIQNLKTYFYTTDGIGKAVDDVTINLNKGETLGLVGDTGGIVLALSTHMHRQLAFNETDRTITVEPGMLGPDLERLLNGLPTGQYNLGNGDGYSVKEVIEIARNITGRPIPSRVVERRAGDPAVLVGSSEKAMNELGWRPQFPELETIVETAWKWHKANPDGYGGV